jgi:hypothetical protein
LCSYYVTPEAADHGQSMESIGLMAIFHPKNNAFVPPGFIVNCVSASFMLQF